MRCGVRRVTGAGAYHLCCGPGADGEAKINDVPDRGRAEETGRFLDLLHVFMQPSCRLMQKSLRQAEGFVVLRVLVHGRRSVRVVSTA